MKILHVACLAGVLWLTGCATQGTSSSSSSSASSDASGASAQDGKAGSPWGLNAPNTPQLARGPLQPITAATAGGNGSVASLTAPADLWDRIRRGFAMPDLEDDLVQEREQWYSTRPDYILRMTQRSSKYLFHIVEELERRGMPTELALLPYIESAFNPQAVSSAKAAGMWQFMPATGNYFDLSKTPSGTTAATCWRPPAPHWTTCKSCTACLATGTWHWPPTTGAKAAWAAP